MTDLLDTPEGREAVEAMVASRRGSMPQSMASDRYYRAAETESLTAALPALERLFRRKHAEELEAEIDKCADDELGSWMKAGYHTSARLLRELP